MRAKGSVVLSVPSLGFQSPLLRLINLVSIFALQLFVALRNV